MKVNLTVICPGIRPQKWQKLYDSVGSSFSGSWEIIFIGPYGLPESLINKPNVKYIEDWGTPIRCQQIGLINSQGDWINWAADDGYFHPQSMDIAFEKLKKVNFDYKTVVMGKYLEGSLQYFTMLADEYYVLSNHEGSHKVKLPAHYLMLNLGLVSRKLLLEVGGWDCQFEVCPMAYNDLAIRLQNYGCPFIIQNEIMFSCKHLPGRAGDHGPIHDAQIDHDEPLFRTIYNQDDAMQRVKIDINNWKNVPDRWERRFNAN